MGQLAGWLGVLVIGFVGLSVVAWGWIAWLPLAIQVQQTHGDLWGRGAFALGGAVTVAGAIGLWRLQAALARRLDPHAPDRQAMVRELYCRPCNRFVPASSPASRCPTCGARLAP